MSGFITEETRKARDQYWCEECFGDIRKGDVYVHLSGWDPDCGWFRGRVCPTCRSIENKYHDLIYYEFGERPNARTIYEILRDTMDEEDFAKVLDEAKGSAGYEDRLKGVAP